MGRSTLLIVLAAIVGGSYLTLNVLRTQTETTGRRSNSQANVLARQLAESGQAIALSSITQLDGFSNGGVFVDSVDHNGGKIHFEDYNDTLTPDTPHGERVAIQVSGQYGGATHRLSSVYEFDPMDFPGPLWIDVPYAAGDIHPDASFSGGTFGYRPQVTPDKYNDLDISSLGLSLDDIKTAIEATNINGTGASVPKWKDDGLTRTADLGEGTTSADDLYFQISNAIDTSAGDVVIAGPHTVSGPVTYGAPDAITHIDGDLTVTPGGRLTGQGALIVEGDLVVQGQMTWSGIVIVRSTEQALTVDLTLTQITGALVVSQEAFPPGGHMDVSVYREPTGSNTAPYGRRAAGPGALRASPWGLSTPFPFWQHTHKFDLPTAGAADFTARSDREIRFVDDDAGDPQESYTGLRELLNHLGSQKVYVQFDNLDNHGHAIVEMDVDGRDAVERAVSMGFVDTALEGGSKHRSTAFEARDLERLVVRPQSLRSLRKLWDTNGVCSGASPAEWPICVGYDRADREGSLTMRVRRASNNAMLYEGAVYWHMQAGQEHDDYLADVAAWQAAVSSGSTPFGTSFTMSANSSMTYDIVPIVSLAEKVGFKGNQVIHISTESGLTEAGLLASAGGGPSLSASPGAPSGVKGTGAGGLTPTAADPDPDGDGMVPICHKPGIGAESSTTISVGSLTSHLGHGDTVGACGGAPGGGGGSITTTTGTAPEQVAPACGTEPLLPVAICNKPGKDGLWRDRTVPCNSVQNHLDHGCKVGSCQANGANEPSGGGSSVSERLVATASQPIPSNQNTKVKVCRPDGGNPSASWNEEEMKFKNVEAYLASHEHALYGTCSDHNK